MLGEQLINIFGCAELKDVRDELSKVLIKS